jgi:hemerythrin-like domain-containing protein
VGTLLVCDYCDCRSQPEIAALSADHERLLSMTAALRRSLAVGVPIERRDLGELADLLLPHAEREEIGVFAALRDGGVETEYVGRYEDDHRRIDDLLAGAARLPSAAGPLIELVEDHILREETDLFPAARQLLAPERWDAVDQRVLRAS